MKKILYIQSKKTVLKTCSRQSGFSLIEVMVAALVLSIGILGVASLQIVGLKGTQQSYMKQQAMSVIQNLTERMRSNKQGVVDGDYEIADSDAFDCAELSLPDCSSLNSNCSSSELATADLHNLICGYKAASSSRTGGIRNLSAEDISTFIDGKLTIGCTNVSGCSTGDLSIEVNWLERAIDKTEVAIAPDSLLINTRIAP